jgi:tripartite-type tricarboxylate transporter receptor subunit TctC
LPDEEILVEDVPGEGGLAGVRRANALAREGKPVLMLATPSTHVLLPLRLGESAAPDARFAPVVGLGRAPNVLLVSPRLGIKSVGQLIELARVEELVYASAGTGQTIHLCTAYFCQLAGIRMAHKPYDRGSVHAYADLIAGRVQVYFDNLLGCADVIARGDALPLAVSARQRNGPLPAVPTLAECGFPEHALEIWFGVFGAGLNPSVLQAVERARTASRLGPSLASLGLSGGIGDANALSNEIDATREGWRRALEAAST